MSEFVLDSDGELTHVIVRAGGLQEVGPTLAQFTRDPQGCTILVISDDCVSVHYGDQVLESLRAAGFSADLHTFPRGEQSKSLDVLGNVYTALASRQLGRDGVIVALGGGVVSDVAGLAAATWLRGIQFAICPTTLEADIDAAIGGKTAINLAEGKNLVGAFHQPVLVVVDPSCLKTLDSRDVRAGLAESVKHALIHDESFLSWHEDHVEQLLSLEAEVLAELIERNIRIKASFVERDAREQCGSRIMLNFGHTIGHAIELCSAYRLRHGECVALGMIASCRLSQRLGLLSTQQVERVTELLERLGLPTVLSDKIASDVILSAMKRDKKRQAGRIRMVLLNGLGDSVVRDDVPEEMLLAAYESLWD